MRFPGDPAIPAEIPLVHSLVLNELELLVAKDVVEIASRSGDAIGLTFGEGVIGLISGESIGGEGLEEILLVPFALENFAACFVTAATTPPPSLPFFRSFLPGMNGDQRNNGAVSCSRQSNSKHP